MKVLPLEEAKQLLKKWKHSGAIPALEKLYERHKEGVKTFAETAEEMDEISLFEEMELMAEDDHNYIFAVHAMVNSEEFE